MSPRPASGELSLCGGPLHRMGERVRLVRGTNTVRLGLALGALSWLLVVGLALAEGVASQFFSVALVAGHLRLLVVIPLLFLCESILDPLLATFVRGLVAAGVVLERERDALWRLVASTNRWRDSWLPELFCLLVALLLPWLGASSRVLGTTGVYDATRSIAPGSLAGQAYWLVALTLFRFLVLRWIWKLGLWWRFLWRLSRLELRLVPTHPDGAAGLGFLEVVQFAFVPLVAGISVVQAGSLAEGIAAGDALFAEVYPRMVITLGVCAGLVLGPTLVFASKLWASKARGLSRYMVFASRYVDGFDRKWLGAEPPGEALLGTADLQSLADLSNSVNIVRNMRWLPISLRLLIGLSLAVVLPMAPLLLFEYPVAEISRKLVSSLVGL